MKTIRERFVGEAAGQRDHNLAPYGVWRSEGTETRSSLPLVSAEEIDLLPALDEALRDSEQDDTPPVRINEEGLLG